MGRHSCCYKQKLRKGLWSPEEDEKLFNHITKYGHGCWSSVPKQAGNLLLKHQCIKMSANYFILIVSSISLSEKYHASGLQRCGKSCRLRWINYLRPDLKRGTFSEQEENLIIELHAVLGNRLVLIPKIQIICNPISEAENFVVLNPTAGGLRLRHNCLEGQIMRSRIYGILASKRSWDAEALTPAPTSPSLRPKRSKNLNSL